MGLDVNWALRWLELSADAMAEHREELIELDRPIGDSDHGENMDRGFKAVMVKLAEAPPETAGAGPFGVFRQRSRRARHSLGATSWVRLKARLNASSDS